MNVKPTGNPNRYPNPENLQDLKKCHEITKEKQTDMMVIKKLIV